MKCAYYKSAAKVIQLRTFYIFILKSLYSRNEKLKFHAGFSNFIPVLIGKDNPHQGSYSDATQMNGIQPEEVGRLREEIEELKSNQERLQSQLAEKDSLIENLVSKC